MCMRCAWLDSTVVGNAWTYDSTTTTVLKKNYLCFQEHVHGIFLVAVSQKNTRFLWHSLDFRVFQWFTPAKTNGWEEDVETTNSWVPYLFSREVHLGTLVIEYQKNDVFFVKGYPPGSTWGSIARTLMKWLLRPRVFFRKRSWWDIQRTGFYISLETNISSENWWLEDGNGKCQFSEGN